MRAHIRLRLLLWAQHGELWAFFAFFLFLAAREGMIAALDTADWTEVVEFRWVGDYAGV